MRRSGLGAEWWKGGVLFIFAMLTAALLLTMRFRSGAPEVALAASGPDHAATLGAFESQNDVGTTLPGSAEYDPARHLYLVTGGGENMWEGTDAFHYVWRRVRGDLVLTADVQLVGAGGRPHRKAGWVIRQTLDPDSPYVSAVVHGDGLTSLQYRSTKGGTTQEVRSTLVHPLSLRLQRDGDTFTLSAAMEGQPFQTAGSAKVVLHDPVYIGLAVCSHDAAALETAVFSDVTLEGGVFYGEGVGHAMESRLEVMSIDGTNRRVVYKAAERFEAPNWSRDGKYLIFNKGGRLYTISVNGGEPRVLDTGDATNCNNDHGLSPDGKWLAVSNSPRGPSLIYIVPAAGGAARQATENGPSYWHGWSPDGKTLAYCAERNGNFDIYTIPAAGGTETRLTEAEGLDDGPDYSPDGRYIYFNSERTGLMQIWRMHPDGSHQEQITNDGHADWFAHPSPDGKWLIFITFDHNVKTHPPNQEVMLRLLELQDGRPVGEPRVLVKLFGGQGTINVPSWSPDSKSVAFVSYRLLDR